MVKISILYPNDEDSWFDTEYYLNKHIPVVVDIVHKSHGFRGFSIEKGLCGEPPDQKAPFTAACTILFNTLEDFIKAFNLYSDVFCKSIPNFTNAKPIVQVSERIKTCEN